MSAILYFWLLTWVLILLFFVVAGALDAFNHLSRQIKEYLNEHK